MNREHRLARTFVSLADSLVDDFDVVDLMVLLTESCVDLLGASEAGLLLADSQGTLRVMAATSEAIETVELFQAQNDEGPCRDCYHTGVPVSVADLAAESDRWPRFSSIAVEAGFRSAHALPLRLRSTVLGAMNLFGHQPVAMTQADLATAQALADVATIALLQNQTLDDTRVVAEQLEQALTSRVAIEQAKGMIAERMGCGMDEAFSRLRRFARARQARLSDVAREIVEGTLRPERLRAHASPTAVPPQD